MTPFEFVFFLYALMLSLALTHLVGGWALALRHAGQIRWSTPHVTWAVTALFTTTGNLASFWMMRDAPTWNAWLVLSNFAFALVNYIWCVFITPEVERDGTLDLVAFHDVKRRQYLLPYVLLASLAIVGNVVNGMFATYDNWLGDSVFSAVSLSAAIVAIQSSRRRVQLVTGMVSLAGATWFIIAASNIIGH